MTGKMFELMELRGVCEAKMVPFGAYRWSRMPSWSVCWNEASGGRCDGVMVSRWKFSSVMAASTATITDRCVICNKLKKQMYYYHV